MWDSTSAPAHAYLEGLRTDRAVQGDAETQILEVDLSAASPHPAELNNAVVAIDTFTVEGGKPQQLSVTIDYNGDPTKGTVVVTAGVPVFTAAA